MMSERKWLVYLVQCSDQSLYCGITNNLNNRLAVHNAGKGAKYTRSRRPVTLVGVSSEMTMSQALKLEYRVKQVPSSRKQLELTNRKDETIMSIRKELVDAVLKQIKGLTNAIEKMINGDAKPKKAAGKKATKKKSVSKKKAAKRKAPVKKASGKAKAGKKAVQKAPEKKEE
ncbi:MAG: GIY-YIG nuclease family protein [Pseudomonadota bacterium]